MGLCILEWEQGSLLFFYIILYNMLNAFKE